MATAPPEQLVRAADLSISTGIPSHYLSKVLRRLVLAGLLNSQKGQGGGFSLARAPAEITFLDILTAVDAYPTEGRCAFGWGNCDAVHPCPLHPAWSRLGDLLHEWASQSNLADISEDARLNPRLSTSG